MQRGIAAAMSIRECCFINNVETQIKTVIKNIAALKIGFSFVCLLLHNVKKTANEPITCIDGQTFVFVSKL